MGVVAVVILAWVVVGGAIGYLIGNLKGIGRTGFWWGAILGVIGWIVVAAMPDVTEQEVAQMRALERARPPDAQRDTRAQPSPQATPPRYVPTMPYRPPDSYANVRAAAAEEETASELERSIDRFERTHLGRDLLPTEWFFADGSFTLVVRHDGVVSLCRPGLARQTAPDTPVIYDIDSQGVPLTVVIEGWALDNPRPAHNVQAFLTVTQAVLRHVIETVSDQGAGAVDMSAPITQTELPERVSAVAALQELDELRDLKLITPDEYSAKRQAVLDRL